MKNLVHIDTEENLENFKRLLKRMYKSDEIDSVKFGDFCRLQEDFGLSEKNFYFSTMWRFSQEDLLSLKNDWAKIVGLFNPDWKNVSVRCEGG